MDPNWRFMYEKVIYINEPVNDLTIPSTEKSLIIHVLVNYEKLFSSREDVQKIILEKIYRGHGQFFVCGTRATLDHSCNKLTTHIVVRIFFYIVVETSYCFI